MRDGISISLGSVDRKRLEAIVADRNAAQKHVWRARIVLLSADGVGTNSIMAMAAVSKTTIWRWQARFMEAGVDGLLHDKIRPPGTAPVAAETVSEVVRLTQEPPPHEATHWTVQAMAKAIGLAVSTVQKIWKAHGLAPHRWKAFKLGASGNAVILGGRRVTTTFGGVLVGDDAGSGAEWRLFDPFAAHAGAVRLSSHRHRFML